jgi:Rieske Fe-S protein
MRKHTSTQEERDPSRTTTTPDGAPPEEQPKWRKDFPVDWAEDDYVSRRDLVKFMVLTSVAFTVGQSWISLKGLFERTPPTPRATHVAEVSELPVGGAKTFTYPEGSPPRLLIRTGERAFVAYEQQCTHLLCPVVPAVETGRIHCPCHNGWFDLESGRPIAGPPRRPLRRIHLEVRGDDVYATGVAGSST